MLCTLNRLQYNVNINFICTGRPKKITRLISLQYLLYCGGLQGIFKVILITSKLNRVPFREKKIDKFYSKIKRVYLEAFLELGNSFGIRFCLLHKIKFSH